MLLAYQGFEQGVATFYDLPGISIGLCAWSVKDKFLVNEEDLLRLREVASSSYEHGDYDATVKLITWAAKYKSNDEEFSIEYERALTIG